MTGRLYAHFKHEQMKSQVQLISDKENTPEVRKHSKKGLGVWANASEVEDTYKLPYGVGYDDLIKEKTDFMNRQKSQNNFVMD